MEPKLYNLDILKITTEDDHEFLVKILNTFLNNNKEMLDRLEQSYSAGNFTEIGEIAHKMLGSYKHLEIKSVIKPLTELEGLATGKHLEQGEIRELIDHIVTDSTEVFKGIEKEISEITNL